MLVRCFVLHTTSSYISTQFLKPKPQFHNLFFQNIKAISLNVHWRRLNGTSKLKSLTQTLCFRMPFLGSGPFGHPSLMSAASSFFSHPSATGSSAAHELFPSSNSVSSGATSVPTAFDPRNSFAPFRLNQPKPIEATRWQ